MNIGDNIKRYRKENKISQAKLAELIGKSKSSIEKYEANKVQPSLDILKDICKHLNTDISDLLGVTSFNAPVINQLVDDSSLSDDTLSLMMESEELFQMRRTFEKLGYKLELFAMPQIYIVDIENDKTVAITTHNELKVLNNILKNSFKGIIEGFIDSFKCKGGNTDGK